VALLPKWDLWARVEQVEDLLARLRALDEPDLFLGEPVYTVDDLDAHRDAALTRLNALAARHAAELGMAVERLELSPRLQVEVRGPLEAILDVEATVRLAAAP